jgi:hypothetical protein
MPTGNGHDAFSEHEDAAPLREAHEQEAHEEGGINKAVAAVAVVAVGAALFEVALLPGIALGVAAVAAPKYLPRLTGALNPLFKSTVRGTYKLAQKSKEMFAEAREHVHDAVAEAKAESEAAVKETTDRHAAQ